MLRELMSGMQEELQSLNYVSRSFVVSQMFDKDDLIDGRPMPPYSWLTDVPSGRYDNALRAILLGLPVQIYVHEYKDGSTFDVIRGGEFIEGLRYYMMDVDHAKEHLPYHRRILEAKIEILVFRCNMSHEDVKTCLGYLT